MRTGRISILDPVLPSPTPSRGPALTTWGCPYWCSTGPIDLVDDQHPIQLILVLAAVDSKSHLKALSELTQILGDNDKLQVMMQATNAETIEQLIKDGE